MAGNDTVMLRELQLSARAAAGGHEGGWMYPTGWLGLEKRVETLDVLPRQVPLVLRVLVSAYTLI